MCHPSYCPGLANGEQGALTMRETGGTILVGCGLIHLDPSWINDLLRELLDHRLAEQDRTEWWEREMADHRRESGLHLDDLVRAHRIFVASGRLSKPYLEFLWRNVPGLTETGVLDRMINTMVRYGVLFPCHPEERTTEYMVPARLPSAVADATVAELERAISNGVKIQFVFELYANYLPPGVVAQFLGDFCCGDICITFRACWSRGVAFTIGGCEYLICLYEQTPALPTRIEINVAGKDTDTVWNPGFVAQKAMSLHNRYPGLLFYPPGNPIVTRGTDAWRDTLDGLENHFESEMSKVSILVVLYRVVCFLYRTFAMDNSTTTCWFGGVTARQYWCTRVFAKTQR